MELYAQLLTPEMRPVFLTAMFIFGSCIGSFLNVCIWRMPLKESIVFAPSHCTSCGKAIKWYDNIPLVSYLVLGGKCRSCHKHYTMRYFVIELVTAIIFLLLAILCPPENLKLLPIFLTASSVMIAAGMIDAEHAIIPDKLSYFLLFAGILYASIFGIFSPFSGRHHAGIDGFATSIFTAIEVAVFLGIFAVIGKKLAGVTVLGWGDVKLLSAVGASLGLVGVLAITIIASMAGAIFGVLLALVKHQKMAKLHVRFGAFIAIATILYCILFYIVVPRL